MSFAVALLSSLSFQFLAYPYLLGVHGWAFAYLEMAGIALLSIATVVRSVARNRSRR